MATKTPVTYTIRTGTLASLAAMGSTTSYHHRKVTVLEGVPDPGRIDGMGEGDALLYLVRTEAEHVERYSNSSRRRLRVTMVLRGYVYDSENSKKLEQLEHDVWRAMLAGGPLGDNIDEPFIESVEFGEEMITDGDDNDPMIRRGFIEVRVTCGASETLP